MPFVAFTGDTHADEHSRFEEHNRIMPWIVDDARARGCVAIGHAGDVWERRSSPNERIAVADYVQYGSQWMHWVVVGGNHDHPQDIEWIGRLQPKSRLTQIVSMTRPGLVRLPTPTGLIEFACLPWPRKGHLLAQVDAALTHAQTDGQAVVSLQDILRGFGEPVRHTMPRILLAHCMMRGSKVSDQQPPLVGMDFELTLEDIALAQATIAILGHIHLAQDWIASAALQTWRQLAAVGGATLPAGDLLGSGIPVLYTSSPRRCTWGETDPKGYVVAEFSDDGALVGWERVPTPCTPMIHIDGEYSNGSISHDEPESIKGAEVRVRYTVAADQRHEARAVAEGMRDRMLQVDGALAVVLEEVPVVVARSRGAEIAEAPTVAKKLDAYWTQTRRELTPERRERLLQKLASLEEIPLT